MEQVGLLLASITKGTISVTGRDCSTLSLSSSKRRVIIFVSCIFLWKIAIAAPCNVLLPSCLRLSLRCRLQNTRSGLAPSSEEHTSRHFSFVNDCICQLCLQTYDSAVVLQITIFHEESQEISNYALHGEYWNPQPAGEAMHVYVWTKQLACFDYGWLAWLSWRRTKIVWLNASTFLFNFKVPNSSLQVTDRALDYPT